MGFIKPTVVKSDLAQRKGEAAYSNCKCRLKPTGGLDVSGIVVMEVKLLRMQEGPDHTRTMIVGFPNSGMEFIRTAYIN